MDDLETSINWIFRQAHYSVNQQHPSTDYDSSKSKCWSRKTYYRI